MKQSEKLIYAVLTFRWWLFFLFFFIYLFIYLFFFFFFFLRQKGTG